MPSDPKPEIHTYPLPFLSGAMEFRGEPLERVLRVLGVDVAGDDFEPGGPGLRDAVCQELADVGAGVGAEVRGCVGVGLREAAEACAEDVAGGLVVWLRHVVVDGTEE